MLFKQRLEPRIREKVRIFLWPRRSWRRSIDYLRKRVIRLSATPHVIALGFAAGAFASCTPFVGFHFIIAAAIAFVIGGNVIASAIGTAVGNPITFPFIWASTFNIGAMLLPGMKVEFKPGDLSYDFFTQSLESVLPIFSRMLVGAVPLGLVVGGVCYVVVRGLVRAYQERRRVRREQYEAERGNDAEGTPPDGMHDAA